MKKNLLFLVMTFIMTMFMTSCDTNQQLKDAAEELNKQMSTPEFQEQGLKAKSVTYDENTKVFSIVVEVEETMGKQMKAAIEMSPEVGDAMLESFKSSISGDNALVDALAEVGGKLKVEYQLPSGDLVLGKEFTPAELK